MEPMSGQPLCRESTTILSHCQKSMQLFFQSPVKFETYLGEITRSKNAILCVGCTSGVPTDADLN